jgi:hypothetical protein
VVSVIFGLLEQSTIGVSTVCSNRMLTARFTVVWFEAFRRQ